MKNMLKMTKRIFITVVLSVLVIIFINVILDIKYNDKNNNVSADDWNWERENVVINKFLAEKYPSEVDERHFLIMSKDEVIPEKEKDEKRILVVGDSFTYGFAGTNINYTWWKQLNLQIKNAGYSNVNVYAAGMHGLNTEEELELILKNDKLIKMINPDLIIMSYITNDPDRRDSSGRTVLKEDWEISVQDHPIYKRSSNLYYEMVNRMNLLEVDDEVELRKLGDTLGFYRWDIRRLMIVEGENLEYYKGILKAVDNRMKELDIPYFYFNTDYSESEFIERANDIVYKTMDSLSVKIYHGLNSTKIHNSIDPDNPTFFWINPADAHPSVIWNYNCGKYVYEVLEKDYEFLFKNKKMQDINDLELNINDTMPFMKVDKIKKNVYEFDYPDEEKIRTEDSRFLYYPIEKNYVKINLEYPKNISKIIITGEGVKSTDVYINTIDNEYGFDFNDVYNKLTPCKEIKKNIYEINSEITSINIHATFYNEKDRNIRVEFLEK